jgi:hypothetical protein
LKESCFWYHQATERRQDIVQPKLKAYHPEHKLNIPAMSGRADAEAIRKLQQLQHSGDDECNICYNDEELEGARKVVLQAYKHRFCEENIQQKWPLTCPICRTTMSLDTFTAILESAIDISSGERGNTGIWKVFVGVKMWTEERTEVFLYLRNSDLIGHCGSIVEQAMTMENV